MRILIVTHAPLSPEFGAGQMAINLGDALRRQGHEVTLWSPHPLPSVSRWFRNIQQLILMRKKLDQFLDTQEPFDIIDCPGVLVTKKISQSSSVLVARSVQPDILYLLSDLIISPKRVLNNLLYLAIHISYLTKGWARANYILCLGSLELEWMKNWFPWWEKKLLFYVNAISEYEQAEFSKIRFNRIVSIKDGVKFLWIGRWSNHKGIKKLVKFIVDRYVSHPHDTFTLAGCGNYAQKDFPDDLIKSQRLIIIPSFDRSDIISLLKDSNVGLFTSNVEGWGLSLNEMLESGMLVFATIAGGVPDLQTFCKNLLSFPPPRKFSFEIFENLQISEHYYNSFTWNKIADKYDSEIISRSGNINRTKNA